MSGPCTAPAPALSRLRDAEGRARQADAALVSRCRNGDESAWTAIVERFSNYVYAIAIRFGLSDGRAQDVYQEVFTRAFTHLGSLRDDAALKPWIAQLTRRAAVDRLRADAREAPAPEPDEQPGEEADLELIEQAMIVQRALDDIPAQYGEAVRRFFLQDQSYRTIAQAVGIPPGTVASRISRGLSMLREVLEKDA